MGIGGTKMINIFIATFNAANPRLKLSTTLIMNGTQNTYPKALPNGFNLPIRRESLQTQTDKYIEKISWGGSKPMAVAIGLNPSAILPSGLDKTNELVMYCLYQTRKYSGYYLINLYSRVQPTGFKKGTHNDQINCLVDTLNAFAQAHNLMSIDVIFFFGCSFYVSEQQLKSIQGIQHASFYTIGDAMHRHHHPGRGVSASTIRLTPLANVTLTNHRLK